MSGRKFLDFFCHFRFSGIRCHEFWKRLAIPPKVTNCSQNKRRNESQLGSKWMQTWRDKIRSHLPPWSSRATKVLMPASLDCRQQLNKEKRRDRSVKTKSVLQCSWNYLGTGCGTQGADVINKFKSSTNLF